MKVYVVSNGVGDFYGPYFRDVCATKEAAEKYIQEALPGSYSTIHDWEIEEKELIGATDDADRGRPSETSVSAQQPLETLRAISTALQQGAASLSFMGQHVDRTIEQLSAADRDREALAAHWAPPVPIKRYFDDFTDHSSMVEQWSGSKDVKDEEVIFARYDCPPYEGYAICVYRRDGKLFEVNDNHCSCYGLENWDPEETSVEALLMRDSFTPEIRSLIENARQI